MGAGLARQAALRFPTVAGRYGAICSMYGALTPTVIMAEERLIMFPVKHLRVEAPHLSWQHGATLPLIGRSAEELAELEPSLDGDIIAVPWVGCGNGGLKSDDVYPILWKHLRSDRFVLCKGALGDPRAQGHALATSPTKIFPSALSHGEKKAVHEGGTSGDRRITDRKAAS